MFEDHLREMLAVIPEREQSRLLLRVVDGDVAAKFRHELCRELCKGALSICDAPKSRCGALR